MQCPSIRKDMLLKDKEDEYAIKEHTLVLASPIEPGATLKAEER